MEGFLIETRCEGSSAAGGAVVRTWMAVAMSARDIFTIFRVPHARVVDRGPTVLARARALGVLDGHVREIDD